jgi:hypothetical protein
MAKRIIHLVIKVGEKINHDPDTSDLLRLYFLPDYNVSLAEVIIPGGGEGGGYCHLSAREGGGGLGVAWGGHHPRWVEGGGVVWGVAAGGVS